VGGEGKNQESILIKRGGEMRGEKAYTKGRSSLRRGHKTTCHKKSRRTLEKMHRRHSERGWKRGGRIITRKRSLATPDRKRGGQGGRKKYRQEERGG